MTNFWSGGMRENEKKKCHQGSLLCCIWLCLWATLSVSQKSWATAAIREDRHFQSRFLGGGWDEGQRERRREWGGGGWRWRQGTSCTAMTSFSCSGIYIGRGQSILHTSLTFKASWRQEKSRRVSKRELLQCLSVWTCFSEAERWWQDWTFSWCAWCFWLSAPGVCAQVSTTTSPNSLKWFLLQSAGAPVKWIQKFLSPLSNCLSVTETVSVTFLSCSDCKNWNVYFPSKSL